MDAKVAKIPMITVYPVCKLIFYKIINVLKIVVLDSGGIIQEIYVNNANYKIVRNVPIKVVVYHVIKDSV